MAKCPNCGAEIEFTKDKNTKALCAYCGSQIPNSLMEFGQNHEFELKFATAENWADLYYKCGPDTVIYRNGPNTIKGFEAVIEYYKEAETAGPNESKYYISLSRFFVNANLEGFKKGTRHLLSRIKFINSYIFIMDCAIRYADESEKANLENEKQRVLDILNKQLPKHPK